MEVIKKEITYKCLTNDDLAEVSQEVIKAESSGWKCIEMTTDSVQGDEENYYEVKVVLVLEKYHCIWHLKHLVKET